MPKAENTLEAEASRSAAQHPQHATLRTRECFLVSARRGMPLSEPIAGKENSAKVFSPIF